MPRMLQFESGGSKYQYLPYCLIKSILIQSVAIFSLCFQLRDPIGWDVYCTLIYYTSMRKWPPFGFKCFSIEQYGRYVYLDPSDSNCNICGLGVRI